MKTSKMSLAGASSSTLVAAIVFVIAIAVIFIGRQSILSPGPLNAQAAQLPLGGVSTHAELARQCSACHAPPWSSDTMAQRCLKCHTDIAAELDNPHTVHGMVLTAGRPLSCKEGCHTDHRGATALLTLSGNEHSPANLKGYSLKGHQTKSDGSAFSCLDCHQNGVNRFDIKLCLDCHNDIDRNFAQTHLGEFGAACLNCHDGIDTYGKVFDHDLVKFKLLGKHASVACGDCHKNARTIGQLKVASQDCYSCHLKDDKHSGKYGQDCAQCHDTTDWKQVTIDHSKTAFILTGKHITAACTDCHLNGVFKGTPGTCNACHAKDDKHQGTLGINCSQCHNTTDWKQATIDHSKTAFILTGKHTTVACAACHINIVFKGTPATCNACHAKDDKHQGALGINCSQCHNTTDWKQATIDHSKTAFILTGKHTTVACAACHINGVFKGTPTDCYSCHRTKDKHNGAYGQVCSQCHNTTDWKQATIDHSKTAFALTGKHTTVACASCHINGVFKGTPIDCYSCHRTKDKHNGAYGQVCSQCHNTTDWKQATIDHSKTAFPLTGKHTTVACAACHINGVFKGTPIDCYSCHRTKNKHNGAYGQVCSQCHNTTDWKQATIDHSKTAFPLTGKHTTVACAACHINSVFKGTPNTCYACHKQKDAHQGAFGQNCAECHNTGGWKPATYNRPHTFPINHGRASGCTPCHPSGLLTYSCYSCHSLASMQSRHRNVSNLQDCIRCHPTGRGD